MWFECGDVFINLDHVDYISFEEVEEKGKATIFFESGDSLNFAHSDVRFLKKHFRKIFEVKNANRRSTGSQCSDDGKTTEMG